MVCAAGVLFFTILTWVSLTAGGRAERDPVAARLLGALDRHVQERFKDTDKGFGFARMLPNWAFETDESGQRRLRQHILGRPVQALAAPSFEAENASEQAALRDLEQEGITAILYLGSRQAVVKGPVVLTPAATGDAASAPAFPNPSELRAPGARALNAFGGTESYAFSASGWEFIAKPVRASAQSCVECHDAALGQVIGVALYGYRTARR
jgi:hypothetical protein